MSVLVEHLHYDFFQRVLLACILVGAVCSLFSVYVVLRRLVFVGVALTQISSAGLGIAVLTGLPALPTSLAATILGVGFLGLVQPGRKGRTDNLVALLYIGGWAVSILLFALAERGDTEMAAILYGDILGVLAHDIYMFLPVAVTVSVLVLILGKELLFTSFDPETAATYRIPVWLYDTVLFTTLALVIVFAVKMLGLLLVFAFLVAPGTAALLFCKRMAPAMAFSLGFSVAMSAAGLALAALLDLPPGPAVTATGLALLFCVWGASKAAALLQRRRRAASVSAIAEYGRVALVVAALVAVTALSAALASRVGLERTAEHLLEHSQPPAAVYEDVGKAPSPGLPDAVEYAPSLGEALPSADDILGSTRPQHTQRNEGGEGGGSGSGQPPLQAHGSQSEAPGPLRPAAKNP
jgi:ABC-type Mn2+/Zn2+ transport system permease subunit